MLELHGCEATCNRKLHCTADNHDCHCSWSKDRGEAKQQELIRMTGAAEIDVLNLTSYAARAESTAEGDTFEAKE